MIEPHQVAIARTAAARYPSAPPFHPHEAYPEAPFPDTSPDEPNEAYAAVRRCLELAGLDAAHAGTAAWNPLAHVIEPGQFVLLKPNFVKQDHPRDPEGWAYTLTHGSVIRAELDYVVKALDGRGRIMVADAPQTDSDFDAIACIVGLTEIQRYYREHGIDIEVVDLRQERWITVDQVIQQRIRQPGDPQGYRRFDLGRDSEFVDHGGAGRYYGAEYDEGELNRHHSDGRHEYMLCGSAIDCDVLINLPKLKTHKKAGVTINLKNLVGVNGDKNWLPHHTAGFPADGGDQYPDVYTLRRLEMVATRTLRRVALRTPGLGKIFMRHARRAGTRVFGATSEVILSGNWHGNDTAWRMCLDLNKIVLFGRGQGHLPTPGGDGELPTPGGDGELPLAGTSTRKRYLSFVDGIVAGQGSGPLDPDPLDGRAVLFGTDPVAVDAAAATLMGFDIRRLPIIDHAFDTRGHRITDLRAAADIVCRSNQPGLTGTLAQLAASDDLLGARPHFGWTGQLEPSYRRS